MKLVTSAIVLFFPLALYSDDLVTINPGTSITLKPSVETTITCRPTDGPKCICARFSRLECWAGYYCYNEAYVGLFLVTPSKNMLLKDWATDGKKEEEIKFFDQCAAAASAETQCK